MRIVEAAGTIFLALSTARIALGQYGLSQNEYDPPEGHERVLFVIPAFEITNKQAPPPYTPKEKLMLSSRQVFDPFIWVATGIQTGFSQADKEFPEYGQGTIGFGKRYGAEMLDTIDGGLASTAFRIMLKQDPRYFRLGHGSIKRRIAYSLGQEFITRGDSGKREFNWSRVLGSLASASLSNLYYPPPNRGLGLTMNRFALGFLWDPSGLLMDEFWPDIDRRMARFVHRFSGH